MFAPGSETKRVAAALLGVATLAALTRRVAHPRRTLTSPQASAPAGEHPGVGDIVRGSDLWTIGRGGPVVEATDTNSGI